MVGRVVVRGAGGGGAASRATTAGGVGHGPARGWRLARTVVRGILPRALLHGRGAGARGSSPLARQDAVLQVLEVALERVLRILVAFLLAAAAAAAAGFGVLVVQRSQLLLALSHLTIDLDLPKARFGQHRARSVHT